MVVKSKPKARLSAQGTRRKKGSNLSRKQIFEIHRKAYEEKQKKIEEAKQNEKREKVEKIQKTQNKKAKKVFDRTILSAVQRGLEEAISELGETVTPLSLFFSAFTTLAKAPEKHHIPYLFTIVSACIPRISQGVLLGQLENAFHLAESIISENLTTNHLITTKAMKMTQSFLLAVQVPTMELVRKYAKLQPGKLQVDLVKLYLTSFRKLLEQCALGVLSADGSADSQQYHQNIRDERNGFFILNERQQFYVAAVPSFVDTCLYYMTDSPVTVASTAVEELGYLLERTLSPYIVESVEGGQMIDNLLSHQLLSLLKPLYQSYWPLAAKLLERFFDRINYLKRIRVSPSSVAQTDHRNTQENFNVPFTSRFPSSAFVLKVLNKLRTMNDVSLNGPVERAMVALGKGMTVREFVEILPFDPRSAFEAEKALLGHPEEIQELWSTSYTLNVLRRIAFHDSLPFFVEYFFPRIQFCSRAAVEAEREQRKEEVVQWSALITQYWRIAAAFCHFPNEVTNDSFRELAKQLVNLLGQPGFVDTGATAIHVLCDGYYKLAKTEEDRLDDEYDEGDEVNGGEEFLEDDMRHRERLHGEGGRKFVHKDALDTDNYFLSMNDPEWNIHAFHNIGQAYAANVCQAIFGKYSVNIMPKLCNTFETHPSTAVLLAIQSFSKVCAPNVMTTILQGILDLGNKIATQSQVPSEREKAGHAPLSSKRRMVLDIACAVVSQLPQENILQLFNEIIEPVLMDPAPESRQLQKKAYKLLFNLFEQRIKEIFPLFQRIATLLSIGRQHVTISGIKMRIRCLSWALDTCKIYYPDQIVQTVSALLGEVVSCSRERSSETRTMSMEVLEKMQNYLTQAGAPVNTLLRQIVAGFATKTPHMMSSTLVCMAKVVYLTHDQLPEGDLVSAVHLGFQLMESAALEVRNAAAIFARMTLKLAKRSPTMYKAVDKSLEKLLFAIALITSQPTVPSTTRVQMRVLIEKCIKRYGFERLDKVFPVGSKKFLTYCHKMMRHEERKAEKELEKKKNLHRNEFDKLFLGLSMHQGDGEDVGEDLLEAGALNSFVSKHTAPRLPFLGSSNNDDDDDDEDNMHLDIMQDGKLRIISTEEKRTEDDLKRRQALAQRLLGKKTTLINPDSINSSAQSRPGKRGRSEAEDLENDELIRRYGSKTTAEAVRKATEQGNAAMGPGANQLAKMRDQKAEKREFKRQKMEEDIKKGEEFRGTGAGDIRRGTIEPYAYVPLNRRYMNKRHARQAVERFETIASKNLKGEKAKALNAISSKRKKQ